MFFKFSCAFFVVVLVGATLVALPEGDGRASASEAEKAARYWVDTGTVQPARLEDDEWEVDVRRADGSLVEVTIDRGLELRDIDEEVGPGGARAHDEVTGPLRHRAMLAAMAVTGPGRVASVERDSPSEVEVNVARPDGTQIEVELDAELRVGEVEPEDPGDE